eukprot:g2610.t1
MKTESSSSSSSTSSSSSSSSKSAMEDKIIVETLRKKGQRFPEESPGSADYVFYQTLHDEFPESDMALVWCIEHGVFTAKTAEKMYEKYLISKKKLLKLNKEGLSSGKRVKDEDDDFASPEKKKKKKRKTKKGVQITNDVAVDSGMSTMMSEGVGSASFV